MEPSLKVIQELRSSFLQKLEDNDALLQEGFHPSDINRVKNDDDWLRRFLMHNDNDQKEALNMLWETCDWRKKFGVNDITEKNVNMNILEEGSIFSHNRDKDGKALLIFKSKKHVKGVHDFEDLKRCLVYWMERLERQEKGEMISIFFDMDGAGISNMDMEYTKYLIGLFKNHYPYFLNYILIFEMAWVLNAAFKIIKSWLPPKAVQKIKFLNKSSLKEFVESDQALRSWGGNDDYVFRFEPESRTASKTSTLDEIKKKVHFADGSSSQEQNESGFVDTPLSDEATITKLIIIPSDIMSFSNDGTELTGTIILKNEDSKIISYKIKTTSPEKFRVRPSSGILSPGGQITVSVVLQPGYHIPGLFRDKFLIMSIPIETSDITNQDLIEIWKQTPDKDIQQHRLRCTVSQVGASDSVLKNGIAFGGTQGADDEKFSKIFKNLNRIQTHVVSLKEEINLVQRQQKILLIVIFFLAIISAYLSYLNRQWDTENFGKKDQTCQMEHSTEP